MRAGIRLKLFLTLLAAIFAMVLVMGLLVQWSFDRGFRRYVDTLEEARLGQVGEELVAAHAASGSWEFLQDHPGVWRRILFDVAPQREPVPARPDRPGRRPGREGRPDERRDVPPPNVFEGRVFLLDGEQQLLAGRRGAGKPAVLRPLLQEGEPIGYLGLLPNRKLIDPRQQSFVQEQKRAFLVIALLLATAGALLALPLASRLLRPIRALAAATRRLAAGDYASRVAVASDDELGQLADDFNRLARTLAENESARRQWVADISHELRTPLAVLRGELEALQDGVRPQDPAALASLHGEVLRLARLVDDLHQLSLADLGALQYHKESLDLRELLDAALGTLRSAAASRRLSVIGDLAPGCTVFADPQRLQQLFANLFANALQYTDPPGCIEVHLRRTGAQVRIEISDSAPGVPPGDLGRLFERLYRVENSRSRESGGSGLGLAICRSIVAAHDGTIAAVASPLGGVTIRVTLPLERRSA